MYPSKGSNPYGHQPYGAHQGYGQMPGSGGYGAPNASLSARIASGPESDVAGYRSHATPPGSQYGGGAYSSTYGSSSLGSASQVGGLSSKQPGSSSHTGLPGLGSSLGIDADDYISASSRGYGADYASLERRHYGDHHAGYVPREMPTDLERRYADPLGPSLRQQQLLKAPIAPSSELRQSEYYSSQDLYATRGPPEADPRAALSILGSVPYRAGAQTSLLASDLRRNDSLASSYGVSLPPGRDYSTTSATSIRDVIRDEDLRRDILLHDKERDRERERERDRLRDRERDRERDCEREKDRARERERERERERDKEREREREREREKQRAREREKELERKLQLEPRRDRSKDRRGSSVLRDDRNARRASPHRDSMIRPRSPVREKKREYMCKVFPFCLVDVERDYPSLTRRYPKLAVAPDFSKVVVNWPKESMNLSLYTPVSFEHDFVEFNDEGRASTEQTMSSNKEDIVWNAKVLLMSGISNNALSELSSSSDERAIHLSHVLKFAIVRKDRELLPIGGSWNPAIDGGDPLVSDYGLIKAAIRHVKEATQVDLQGCQHWNRFLEIHYERVGKEGSGSRKEITVLFVPNLSECIPAIEAWRAEWLAHRKALSEREQKEDKKQKEKKEEHEDFKKETREGAKSSNKSENSNSPKNKRPASKTEKVDSTKAEDKDNKAVPSGEQIPIDIDKKEVKTEVNVNNNEIKTEMKAEQEETAMEESGPAKKAIKKKIVKRVIKKKAPEEDASASAIVTPKKEDIAAEQSKDKDLVPETDVTKTKKKVIRRVVKRKVVATGAKENMASEKVEVVEDVKTEKEKKEENLNAEGVADMSQVKMEVEAQALHKEREKEKEENKETKDKEREKEKDREKEKKEKEREDKEKKSESKHKSSSQKDAKERSKHEEPPKHPGFILQLARKKGSRIRSTTISLDGLLDYNDKDIAESTFEISLFAEALNEMFQYQMGCRILSFLEKLRRHYIIKKNQRKREREREEKEKERERESEKKRAKTSEVKESENKEKGSSNKNERDNENVVNKMKIDKPREENKKVKESNNEEYEEIEEEPVEEVEEEPEEIEEEPEEMEEEPEEMEEEPEEMEEEPEEIEEEPEEMEEPEDALDKDPVASHSTNKDVKKPKEADKTSKEDGKEVHNGEDEKSKESSGKKASEGTSSKEGKASSEKGEEKKEAVVDKELLQAFRYFDQNRAGFIKVEDLRCIIHNLGKFLSHRDVKEMVQTALFESNSARDNRIFYTRLVRISNL